jgi:hypothetical protein
LQINDNLPTNTQTQMWIAQNVFTSNIVTIPIVALVPPVTTSSAVPAHEKRPIKHGVDSPRP